MNTRKISIIDKENTHELPKYGRRETTARILPPLLFTPSASFLSSPPFESHIHANDHTKLNALKDTVSLLKKKRRKKSFFGSIRLVS